MMPNPRAWYLLSLLRALTYEEVQVAGLCESWQLGKTVRSPEVRRAGVGTGVVEPESKEKSYSPALRLKLALMTQQTAVTYT